MTSGDDERAGADATGATKPPATAGTSTPRGRRPRRAIRPPGTVGTDDSLLVSTLPAAPKTNPLGTSSEGARPAARPTDRSTDALLAARSADDSDVGWGDGRDDNDDRLRLDKPPHWG